MKFAIEIKMPGWLAPRMFKRGRKVATWERAGLAESAALRLRDQAGVKTKIKITK